MKSGKIMLPSKMAGKRYFFFQILKKGEQASAREKESKKKKKERKRPLKVLTFEWWALRKRVSAEKGEVSNGERKRKKEMSKKRKKKKKKRAKRKRKNPSFFSARMRSASLDFIPIQKRGRQKMGGKGKNHVFF
jgi:hypothetical protein